MEALIANVALIALITLTVICMEQKAFIKQLKKTFLVL